MGKILITSLLLVCNLLVIDAHAKTIPELNSNTTPTTSDLTYTVDVSDTTDGSSGTGKKATIAQVFKAANMTIDGTNVGVASTAPGARVDVVGTVRATAFSGDGSALTGISASGGGGWTDGGTSIYNTTSTDNVGIGTTIAPNKLYVKGSTYLDGALNVAGTGSGISFTNSIILDTTNSAVLNVTGGNIGINSTAPRTKLDVVGDVTASTFIGALTGNVTGNVTGNLTGAVTGNASTATALAADPSACTSGDFVSDIAANGTLTCSTPAGGATGWTDGGTNIYNTTTSDNVGIGTTTPTSKLTVAGAITTTGTTAGSLVMSEASANGSNTITFSAPSSLTGDRTCTLEDDSTPFDGCISSPASSGWTDGGTDIYVSTTTDNVGIGTTVPAALLSVGSSSGFRVNATGNITRIGGGTYTIDNDDFSPSVSGPYTIANVSTGSSASMSIVGGANAASFLSIKSTSASGTSDYIRFMTGNSVEKMRIMSGGNVGIGTAAPIATLQVTGETNITGISGDGTGKAVCIKADGNLGTCSDVVGVSGTCTCG